jgi:hypothetical protein
MALALPLATDRTQYWKSVPMIARVLTLGALAVFTANVANATVYFNNLTLPATGSDGPALDSVAPLGASFTAAATPDFLSVSLLLSASSPGDGGSVLVFLSPDNGSGGSNGVAGMPDFATTLAGSQLLATIPDSSLTTTAALLTINVPLAGFTTLDDEYWVMLAPSGSTSFQWYYETSSSGGTGLAGQSSTYEFGGAYATGSDYSPSGAYLMEVSAPEPATFAILGASLVGLGVARRRKTKQA